MPVTKHVTCRLAVAAFVLAWAATAEAQGAPSAVVERVDDSIVFRGRIDRASVDAFLRALQPAPVRRLVITSGGGLVLPALEMAEAVWQAGLDLEVPQSCLSSCANYVFPAARRKLLGRPDAIGWHGNMAHVLYLAQTGQAQWRPSELADAYLLARREDAFYRRIGVDGFVAWFGKIAPYAVPDFYALSPEDMARFGIRDVALRADAGGPAQADVRLLAVDAATVAAIRPAVRLEEGR